MTWRAVPRRTAQLDPTQHPLLVRQHDAYAARRGVDPEERALRVPRCRASASSSCPLPGRPVAPRADLDRAGVRVVLTGARCTTKRSRGSTACDGFAPLDERHRSLEQLLEAEIVQLLQPVEPVHVDVRNGDRPSYCCTIVNVGLVTVSVTPRPRCQALGKCGLARAELAGRARRRRRRAASTPTARQPCRCDRPPACDLHATRCQRPLRRDEIGGAIPRASCRRYAVPPTGATSGSGSPCDRRVRMRTPGPRILVMPSLVCNKQLRREVAERHDDARVG